MTIPFNRIPAGLRTPGRYAEVNSGANFYAGDNRLIVIGQKLSGGSAAVDVPVQVSNDAIALFGSGSMLAEMVRIARRNHPFSEVWALPLADPAGVAAVWTLTIAGTLVPGTLTAYIAGRKVAVAVSSIDTVSTVAAALAAKINEGFASLDGLTYAHAVSATSAAGVVTITARHVGAASNTIGIEKDYVGDEGPNAALITIAQTVVGTGTPSLTAGLAALGSLEFRHFAMPYPDATSLNTMKDFLSDSGGRWDPVKGLYGCAFSANFGNLAAQSTLGNARNDPMMHIMGVFGSPSPVWDWAAAVAAQVQLHKNLGAPLAQAGEISRPMQGLELVDIKPPKDHSKRWSPVDRNTLYYDGISAYAVLADGTVVIDRLISTYQTNPAGSPDTTFLDVETRYQVAYALLFLKSLLAQTYPRTSIVTENPGSLPGFATIEDIKATVIHGYAQLVDARVMKGLELFARNVQVEQSSDVSRIDMYLPLDVVNQARIFAINATTFLNAAAG